MHLASAICRKVALLRNPRARSVEKRGVARPPHCRSPAASESGRKDWHSVTTEMLGARAGIDAYSSARSTLIVPAWSRQPTDLLDAPPRSACHPARLDVQARRIRARRGDIPAVSPVRECACDKSKYIECL